MESIIPKSEKYLWISRFGNGIHFQEWPVAMPDPSPPKRVPPVYKQWQSADAVGTCRLPYAELHCRTNFSFLEGASHADELVARAAELGYAALAVTDQSSLAGVVRAHVAAKEAGL